MKPVFDLRALGAPLDRTDPFGWLTAASIQFIVIGSFFALLGAFAVGCALHFRTYRASKTTALEQSQAGLVVSAVLVLLGLLLGFTFSLALSRYEQRRMLVIAEANAIGTSYLRTQLLDEPDRTRLSNLLIAYTNNRIELGTVSSNRKTLLAANDRLLTQIWAALSAALDTPRGKALSTPLTLTFNQLIDLDTERKVARTTGIPLAVIGTLYISLIVTAVVVGFVLSGRRQRYVAVVMIALLTLAISMIVDLNRPTAGSIRESQEPLVMLKNLLAQPRADFDQFRSGVVQTPHIEARVSRSRQ